MKGEVKMNTLQLNMLVRGVWEGQNWRDGGRLLVNGSGKVPIETSRAFPTHGGASRSDFTKVSPGQGGTGGAL